MSKSTITLTLKERALLWTVITWFNKPVTGVLKQKLYYTGVWALSRKHERSIEDRIIEIGEWLKERREQEEVSATGETPR